MYVCSTVVTVDVEVRMRRQAASMIVAFLERVRRARREKGKKEEHPPAGDVVLSYKYVCVVECMCLATSRVYTRR